MSKQDPIKRALKQVIKNKQQSGISTQAIVNYLTQVRMLWSHAPAVADMIKRLELDVSRITCHREDRAL